MPDELEAGAYPALDDDCDTYRALLKPNMLAGDKVLPPAFMRRQPHPETGQPRDVDGLSVSLRNGRSEQDTAEAAAAEFERCRAVCKISARSIRAAAPGVLDAVQDAPEHANIVGLPERPADLTTPTGQKIQADAEFLGGELAKRSLIVWPPP